MNFRLIERPIKGPILSMRDFDSQPIGKGSFGQVYRSIHKQTKQVFAIK
jgi:predicted unusual protein kinase regulating ubiquinone biosynthesis (AarF/ABC1/UbiB family)